MLKLKAITKVYSAGDTKVEALKGVDISFRSNEFVSILGPSGCGKTTLLNIIGGLDKYTSGDLKIGGRSTKDFGDRDWDAYRNHSIGFVFQSYNLIPHQSVLSNVELALTLSGVKKSERRRRAKEALEKVGLGDQLRKKPSEMSGGQMQRVAIARAIVNDPDIVLADEPTGALDTETGIQVMEILKEISKDHLVIMVTHNPELAESYSTRIIRMLDGKITGDSKPLDASEMLAEEKIEVEAEIAKRTKRAKKEKKPSMSFATSFGLSLKNLITKKGRTALTSFAGSIGIIGIALIMAVSEGTTAYIDHVQETTLSSYPLTLESQTVDMSALMESFMSVGGEVDHPTDAVYKDPIIGEMVDALSKLETSENDLKAFKNHIENELAKEDSTLKGALSGVQYSYSISPVIYTKNIDGEIVKSDVGELMREMLGDFMLKVSNREDEESERSEMPTMTNPMMGTMMGVNMWQELLPDLEAGDPVSDILEDQYEVVYGTWPNSHDEVVLILNESNELDDLTLYALGLLSQAEIDAIIDAAASGNTLEADDRSWSYEEICNMTFKTVLPADRYKKVGDVYVDVSSQPAIMESLYNDALTLRVVGVIRPDADSETAMLTGSIGYTYKLTEYVIEESKKSEVIKAQLDSPDTDVLTGLPFESSAEDMSDAEKQLEFLAYVETLDTNQLADLFVKIQCLLAEVDGLEAGVEAAFASPEMQDKDALIAMVSGAIASEMGADPSEIAEYFEEMTLEDLKELLRPAVEEQVKAAIAMQVETGIAAQFGPMDSPEMRANALTASITTYTAEQCAMFYDELTVFSDVTYEENLTKLGYVDIDSPSAINLFASTFENKDVIVDVISQYNDSVEEERKIAYTDYLGIMMSSITTIINAITYVLIAFVSVSLVVSSIMIGVITLISVQERTKEIGILRAIGASKRNVSSMFNAETVIIGFASGLLGVLITYLLCIPINLILRYFTGIAALNAFLPIPSAVALVVISVVLTLIAGIIPSRSAAKKDPVVALRTE